ncbi:unnamed protein product [Brassica oleracea var. botrytis]|uniref:Uncharacterized protein n=1 Tax=Brassica oleracea TaxID=3712 RepID=A0A3P6F520_BRAOL|nr:unnamed protein product [Brassica oleracea]
MGLGCTAGPALDRNRPSISSVQMMTREKMAIRKVILDRSFSASSSHHRNFSVSSSYHWSFFFFNPPSRFSSSSSSSSSQIYGAVEDQRSRDDLRRPTNIAVRDWVSHFGDRSPRGPDWP